jgi:thiol:disulfide interchange protein
MNRFRLGVFIAAAVAVPSSCFAQGRLPSRPEPSIHWTASIPTALHQQRETGRPLMVYVKADDCGYCRKMERDTWSDPQVAQRVQERFIALKLDARQHKELVSRLGIKGLPTTMVFDHEGRRLHTLSGYAPPSSILEWLESAPGPVSSASALAGSSQ